MIMNNEKYLKNWKPENIRTIKAVFDSTTKKTISSLISEIERDSVDALALTLFLVAYDLFGSFPQQNYEALFHYDKARAVVDEMIDFLRIHNFSNGAARICLSHCFDELMNSNKVKLDFLINHI